MLGRSDGFFMLGNRLIHHSKSSKLVHTNGEGTAGRRVERRGGDRIKGENISAMHRIGLVPCAKCCGTLNCISWLNILSTI